MSDTLTPLTDEQVAAIRAIPGAPPASFEVRRCRGHWHVACGGHDLMLDGDPFDDEAVANAAAARCNLEANTDAHFASLLADHTALTRRVEELTAALAQSTNRNREIL